MILTDQEEIKKAVLEKLKGMSGEALSNLTSFFGVNQVNSDLDATSIHSQEINPNKEDK